MIILISKKNKSEDYDKADYGVIEETPDEEETTESNNSHKTNKSKKASTTPKPTNTPTLKKKSLLRLHLHKNLMPTQINLPLTQMTILLLLAYTLVMMETS